LRIVGEEQIVKAKYQFLLHNTLSCTKKEEATLIYIYITHMKLKEKRKKPLHLLHPKTNKLPSSKQSKYIHK
jgi:hypothetical protein